MYQQMQCIAIRVHVYGILKFGFLFISDAYVDNVATLL